MSNPPDYLSDPSSNNENNSGNFIVRSAPTITSTTTQVIQKKYQKLKTLILKLKPNGDQQNLSSMNPNELDTYVDQIVDDLKNNLLSNTNHLRERIRQVRPNRNDPQYDEKMIIYKELLEQIIPIMNKLQSLITRTLDQLHHLVQQLWNDISKNNGKGVEPLLEEHQRQIEAHINEQWINDITQLETKLNKLNTIT